MNNQKLMDIFSGLSEYPVVWCTHTGIDNEGNNWLVGHDCKGRKKAMSAIEVTNDIGAINALKTTPIDKGNSLVTDRMYELLGIKKHWWYS